MGPQLKSFFWTSIAVILIAIGLPNTATAARKVVYLSGGGGARLQDITRRINSLRYIYENGPYGQVAQVQAYYPDLEFTIPFTSITYRAYSEAKRQEIADYLLANQGQDLHVITSSMGGGIFRDDIMFRLLSAGGGVFELNSLVSIESMSPNIDPNFIGPAGLHFNMYVSVETSYLGEFARDFMTLTGAGPLVPVNCNGSNCYFIHYSEGINVNSPLDYLRAIEAHGRAVGFGEDGAQLVPNMIMQAFLSGHYEEGMQALRDWLSSLEANSPTVPLPDENDDGGGIGGSGIGDGGGGASGGGVGVESFPVWLGLQTELEHRRLVMCLGK